MNTTFKTSWALASLLLLSACPGDLVAGDDATGGSGFVTDGTEGADGTGSGDEYGTLPRAIVYTAGGGRVSSTTFSARIRIGAPQPAGRTTSNQYRVHLGPGSIQ